MEHQLRDVIIVPYDFSEAAENAANHAAKICEKLNFKLFLYHVINRDTRSAFQDTIDLKGTVISGLGDLAQSIAVEHKIRIEVDAEEGSIFERIAEKAYETGARIMFMGTHGKKGFQHVMGSNALKVITGVPVPTVVFQKRQFTGFQKVLFPVNTFSEVRQKVFMAANLAHLLGSTIYLLRENTEIPEDAARINVITKQITDTFRRGGVRYVDDTAEERGDSAHIVIEYAVEHNMDIILIMTEASISSSFITIAPWVEKIMMNKAMIPVMCINQHELGKAFYDL
ncbi:MAG: universal stress protein [Bacteroidales bacterium]|nr:universal stress protein [Bacteroidales bacterium]